MSPVRKRKSRRARRKPAETGGRLNRVPVSEGYDHRVYTFYGRTSTGKTTLSGSFPGPAILLDFGDRGMESIADRDHVEVSHIDSWGEFESAFWYLHQHPDEFATVIIDTITELQHLAVEKVTGRKIKPGGGVESLSVTLNQWGDVSSMMIAAISSLCALPLDMVFNAQEKFFGGEEDEEPDEDEEIIPRVGPNLVPSAACHLEAMSSVIGYTFIRKVWKKRKVKKGGGRTRTVRKQVPEFCLRIGPDSNYSTKIRKPKHIEVPEVLVDCEYGDLLQIIKGEED